MLRIINERCVEKFDENLEYSAIVSFFLLILTPSIISFVLYVVTFYHRYKSNGSTPIELLVFHRNRRENNLPTHIKSYFIVMMISSVCDLPVYLLMCISNIYKLYAYMKDEEVVSLLPDYAPHNREAYSHLKLVEKLSVFVYILKHSLTFVEFFVFHDIYRAKFLAVS